LPRKLNVMKARRKEKKKEIGKERSPPITNEMQRGKKEGGVHRAIQSKKGFGGIFFPGKGKGGEVAGPKKKSKWCCEFARTGVS